MNIATSATRTEFPLSPRKIIKKTITGSIVWIILLGVFLSFGGSMVAVIVMTMDPTVSSLIGTFAVIIVGFFACIIALTYLYQRWYFAVYFYDLTSDYIIIRKGPITPREITIPYERIQDVYVDQDIFDRLFGLYDVHLSSATMSSGMQAHIDGVEKAAADGLRAKLLETVSRKIGRKS